MEWQAVIGFAVVNGDIILILPFRAVDFGILAVVTGDITLIVPFIAFGPFAHVNDYLILIGPFIGAFIFCRFGAAKERRTGHRPIHPRIKENGSPDCRRPFGTIRRDH